MSKYGSNHHLKNNNNKELNHIVKLVYVQNLPTTIVQNNKSFKKWTTKTSFNQMKINKCLNIAIATTIHPPVLKPNVLAHVLLAVCAFV